jgi:hypothetical protein
MSCGISGVVFCARPRSSAAAAGAPEMIAADRSAPAIAAPAIVDADMTNVERILCVIGILHGSLRRGLSDACRAGPADIMLEITKRFGRGHQAPLAIVPLIVGEYGCRYPFNAAQENIETDLGVEAVAREWRRCFSRCGDELSLSIALRETERDAYC